MLVDFKLNCPADLPECVNCHDHFSRLRPQITEVLITKHFKREAPDFDVKQVLGCRHQHFTHLHKYEESVGKAHIFRAVQNGRHIVYAIDEKKRLIFLRAFKNFKQYEKYLKSKEKILAQISNS